MNELISTDRSIPFMRYRLPAMVLSIILASILLVVR